jgi:lysophospholipase L1-like esterase
MIRGLRWLGLVAAAAFGLAELGLRAEPELPSMRASFAPFQPSERPAVHGLQPDTPGCVELDPHGPAPRAWGMVVGEGEGPPARVLFAGDSVTLGQGVRPEGTFAVRMSEDLAKARGVPVEVVNAGVNAAGYCGIIRSVHHHHENETFDRTVITLFADDLEQRAVVLEGGDLRANPALIDGWVAWAATESFTVNWVWFQALHWAVDRATAGGTQAPEYVSIAGRTVPSRTMENLARSIEGLADKDVLWLLVAPVGLSLCEVDADPTSECAWMAADGDRIAAALDAAGVKWVDLRGLWATGDTSAVQTVEMSWWRNQGRLPVHPNPDGHAQIAEAASSVFIRF